MENELEKKRAPLKKKSINIGKEKKSVCILLTNNGGTESPRSERDFLLQRFILRIRSTTSLIDQQITWHTITDFAYDTRPIRSTLRQLLFFRLTVFTQHSKLTAESFVYRTWMGMNYIYHAPCTIHSKSLFGITAFPQ